MQEQRTGSFGLASISSSNLVDVLIDAAQASFAFDTHSGDIVVKLLADKDVPLNP
jgi:hypothetical protein